MVIHTHGRSGRYNPHLHIIMTSGGINEKTNSWVDVNYIPYKILHKTWQYYFINNVKENNRNKRNHRISQ